MTVRRRQFLEVLAAVPAIGLLSSTAWARHEEATPRPGTSGLIGWGGCGGNLVNLFRTRYPNIADRSNTMTVDFPANTLRLDTPTGNEDAQPVIDNRRVTQHITRLISVLGLGRFSGGIHGLDRMQAMTTDGMVPEEAHCLAVLPFEWEGPIYKNALEQATALVTMPGWKVELVKQESFIKLDNDSISEIMGRVDGHVLRRIANLM